MHVCADPDLCTCMLTPTDRFLPESTSVALRASTIMLKPDVMSIYRSAALRLMDVSVARSLLYSLQVLMVLGGHLEPVMMPNDSTVCRVAP
jgi:hypothetical protein